jgi:hypothetical protein
MFNGRETNNANNAALLKNLCTKPPFNWSFTRTSQNIMNIPAI